MAVLKSLFWDIPLWAMRALLASILGLIFLVVWVLAWLLTKSIIKISALLIKNLLGGKTTIMGLHYLSRVLIIIKIPVMALKTGILALIAWVVPITKR